MSSITNQFALDANPITKQVVLEALLLVTSILESEEGDEAAAARELLGIDKIHLASLKQRIELNTEKEEFNLTLGDHILLYTCFFLFTKFYSEELTDRMLESMDDMDRMHLDEPEIVQLRFYREEMLRMMEQSRVKFSSLPLFLGHIETLENSFPVITK